MDRVERTGIGVAVAGHILLFWLLSLAARAPDDPKPPPPPSMEVAFVEEIALDGAAPAAEAMAQAEAPELGPPEDAAPQPAPAAEPLPAPPPVELAPPPPAPKATPKAKAEPLKREKVVPKPAPVKAKAVPAKAAPKPAPAKKVAAKAAAPAGTGEKTAARGSRIGKNFLAGLSDPSPGKADKPQAPTISANAMAGIVAAIKRQVQPCANRQVNPGPGANRISVRLQLRLNRDGSLASAPKVVSTSGVDDENSRYAKRVSDLAIAAYTGCAPMRGLPEDLYKTAQGGWNNVAINYKLPG